MTSAAETRAREKGKTAFDRILADEREKRAVGHQAATRPSPFCACAEARIPSRLAPCSSGRSRGPGRTLRRSTCGAASRNRLGGSISGVLTTLDGLTSVLSGTVGRRITYRQLCAIDDAGFMGKR